MFKKKLTVPALPTLGLALLLAGCVSGPPLPPANLSEPGWTIRQGQAVWAAKRGAPDVAGEIMVATNSDNRTFVQFTKTPFPLMTARTEGNSWQIESPLQNRRFTGRGSPPRGLMWFQL